MIKYKQRTSRQRMKRDNWLSDILRMQDALDSTIRSMIAYKLTIGPWDDRDVNDGWRVLKSIVESYEKKCGPVKPRKKLGPLDEAEECSCGQKACVCWHDEK